MQNLESDVFMGAQNTQLSGELQNLMTSTTPKNSRQAQGSQKPVYALKDMAGNTEDTITENSLVISYEYLTESSYSEVVVRSISFSIEQCYEIRSFADPDILDNGLEDFDRTENGFTVVGISKGNKCFVDRRVTPSTEEELYYVFPESTRQSTSLILHPPSEIWGYDGKQLIMGVVASCHLETDARYIWYRDGTKIKEGRKCCCVPVKEAGSYSVEVHFGDETAVSEPMLVCPFNELEPASSPITGASVNKDSHGLLPVVEKEEIRFSTKDEIGRGSFGVVYKGMWAATDVAVKHVKIRNAKRLKSVVETEVRVHSMVRHPNIVQIMALSFLKNS